MARATSGVCRRVSLGVAAAPRPLRRSFVARGRTTGWLVSQHTQALCRFLDRPDSLLTVGLGVAQTFRVIQLPNESAKAKCSWQVLPVRHPLAGHAMSGLARHSGDQSTNDG